MKKNMRNVWLLYSEEEAIRNQQYINFYEEEGRELELEIRLIIVERLQFGVKKGKWFMHYEGRKIERPDMAICRIMYPLLTKQLEYMGIKTFNNSMVSEICNDKARTYQYVAKTGISMVDTEFVKQDFIEEKLRNITYPSVIKTVGGHGGTEVFLAKKEEIEEIIRKCKGKDIVIQPLTGNASKDLRVYVIGKQVVAAVLRTARAGFKSNFCLGGEAVLYKLSIEEQNTVNQIIDLFDFDFVGIDFIIGEQGELIFNEIEDVVGSRMLYQCADINIVRLYLEWLNFKVSSTLSK